MIRRAEAPSIPLPTGRINPSLDELMQGGGGGSRIGHTMRQQTVREIDTSTVEERAWQRMQRDPSASASPRPLIGPTTSESIPLEFDIASSSPDAEMLHELVHALRRLVGAALVAERLDGPPGYRNNEEFYATIFENVLRSETGAELRKGYAGESDRGVDPVFSRVESRIANRTGGMWGSLTDEFSPFSSRPSPQEIAWAASEFATVHAQRLRTLKTQSTCLFDRFAQITETTAAFNPIRVFAGRQWQRRRR